MIILDPEDQQPSKDSGFVAGTTLRLPERASTSGFPLPDYETSQALHWNSAPAHPARLTRDRDRDPPLKPSHRPRLSKFWKITLYSLIVYVVLTVAIGVPLIVTFFNRPPKYQPDYVWDDTQTNLASAIITLDAEECENWAYLHDNPELSFFSANITHSLSATDSILLQTNMSPDELDTDNVSGSLVVGMSSDPDEKNVVIVLQVQSTSASLRTDTKACFRENGPSRGLQVYAPRNRSDHDTLDIKLSLYFPMAEDKYYMDEFATSLPKFRQNYTDLSPYIHFRSVTLEGATQPISCQSLDAQQISVKNSLAAVSGSFNVTDKISLDNVEGPIDANISMYHLEGIPPSLSVDTGNSGLNAKIFLSSATSKTSDQGPPNFRGDIRNFNGPIALDISYDDNTVVLPFDFRVVNNQGTCNVTMDEQYHGLFEAQTKLGSVNVEVEGDGRDGDPERLGRTRRLEFDKSKSVAKRGWVGWGLRPDFWDPAEDGMIKVTTSLSSVYLRLISRS